ncbi:MAG: integrase [Methylophilaceae bacterium]
MATFQQRKSGYWQARVRRKGQDPVSQSFRTKTEAEIWARGVEAEIEKGSFVSSALAERSIFSDIAIQFADDFAPHHYRGAAWKHKLDRLVERLGNYSLAAITPIAVAKYRDDRLKDPDSRYTATAKPPRVSNTTVKAELDLLSKVLDVASKEFGIPLPAGNPVANIRKPKPGKGRDRRLNNDEWEALIAECKTSQNQYLYPALILSVETAMRQGELLQLKWTDIDRKRKLAMLLDTDKIKTEEPRAVPLSSKAIAVIDALPSKFNKGRLIPLERMTLYKAFERACDRAQISNYTWHDLRHEALSRLAERGDFTVLEMAAVSGHKTLQMLKRYTHLQAENLAKKLG